MDGTSSHYKTKFGFDAVPADAPFSRMNTIEMCYGTRSECDIDLSVLPGSCGKMNSLCSFFRRRWWARFQGALEKGTNTYTYKCVIRRTHPHPELNEALGVPGTARWRWLADDPTTWEECANGCCEGLT
jgi:hypothetical protein